MSSTTASVLATAAGMFLLGIATIGRWTTPAQVPRRRPSPARRHGLRRGRRRDQPSTEALILQLDTMARRVGSGELLSAAATESELPSQAPPGTDLAVAVHAVRLGRDIGGAVAPVLDAAAATLRARQSVRAEVAAHSAQARLSVRILTVLPLAVAAWTSTSARGRAVLASPLGLLCVGLGGVLNLLGWWWMRQVIRGAGR